MPSQFISSSDTAELFRLGADLFCRETERLASSPIVVALPGGRSIVGLLSAVLQQRQHYPTLNWKNLHFFMLDERFVPLSSKESNFALLKETFFEPMLQSGHIDQHQLNPFEFEPGREAEAIENYSLKLKKLGGRFDICLLGVGEDAHVAALFPEHPALEVRDRLFLSLEDSPKPPSRRMTCSAALLDSSLLTIGLFLGEGKRAALEKFLSPEDSPRSCPAKLIVKAKRWFVISDLVDIAK